MGAGLAVSWGSLGWVGDGGGVDLLTPPGTTVGFFHAW